MDSSQSDETVAPPQLRRNIAVYEAARALLGYISPDFDEISKARGLPGLCDVSLMALRQTWVPGSAWWFVLRWCHLSLTTRVR